MLNFPSSPTIGQQHTVAGKSWEWTGVAWKSVSATSVLVERAEDAAADAEASATLVKNRVISGAGSPEGVVAAPVGLIYTRTDGGPGATLYVKESGTGVSGWVAK